MRPPSSPSSIAGWVAACLLVAFATLTATGFWGYSHDDSFITYRYARNWAETGEFAYNFGETGLGTTAPGYAFFLGLLTRVTGLDAPGGGTLLAVLSLLVVALVVGGWALRGTAPLVQAGVPLLFGCAAFFSRWNIELLGAEQFVTLALGAAAIGLALGRRQPLAAGACLAAAMACRLDAALLAGLLGLALWLRERRFPWRFSAAGLLPLGLFLLLLRHEAGTVIPQTMAAKQLEGAGRLGTPGEDHVTAAGTSGYSATFWKQLRRGLPPASAASLLALAAWGTLHTGLALRRHVRADGEATGWPATASPEATGAIVFASWIVLHEVSYRLLGVPFAPWYSILLVNGLLLAAAGGAVALGRRAPRGLRAVVTIALALPLLVPSLLFVRAFWRRPPDPRWAAYMATGRLIGERETAPVVTVAAVEIGFLGWAAPRKTRILDLAGLVTPAAVGARAEGHLADYVARRQPDYIVDATLFRATWLDPILEHEAIAGHYEEVANLPDDRHPGLRVRLLRRNTGDPRPSATGPNGRKGRDGIDRQSLGLVAGDHALAALP